MRDLMFAILLGQMVFYLGFLGCVRTKPDACRLVARHPPRLCRPFSRRFHGRRSDEWPSIMLPADPDAKIVWSCFVIARHKDGLGVADILPEARFWRMPMTGDEVPLSLQPIPYQGSKRALAPRICEVFPDKIETLYEPFAGSAALTLYAAHHRLARSFAIGDSFCELIDLWDLIINQPARASDRYHALWAEQFVKGHTHFNEVRAQFNQDRDPIRLLYLIARCVKNAVRFNKQGDFSQSVDKRRTGMHPDKMTRTIHAVSKLLRGRTRLFKGDFQDCIAPATPRDLVYMDPPYQGTTYGADKRYAAQLSRETLVEALYTLNERGVSFILSYDGKSGERTYGDPLPASINASHLSLHAGRSSQATLSGRDDETIESLYVSKALDVAHADIFRPTAIQASLFA